MFFDALQKEERSWNPLDVLRDYQGQWCQSSACRLSDSFVKLYSHFDRGEHERRKELYLIIKHLRDQRWLLFGNDIREHHCGGYPMIQLNGMLALYKELHVPLFRMFPSCDQKDISGLSQMTSSNYNLETAFELCGIHQLVTPGEIHSGPKGAAPVELTYMAKGNVIRGILGQLRWASEPDAMECPHLNAPLYLTILAESAYRMLVCEIVFCRVAEYVCRVESVWRNQLVKNGSSKSITYPSKHLCQRRLGNSGMEDFVQRLHDPQFGTQRHGDPRAPIRRSIVNFSWDSVSRPVVGD
jgi:hypothetical protein